MRVMGIDLSTNAGVVVIDGKHGVLHAGVANAPKLSGSARANAIIGRIMEVHTDHKPDLVVIEDYAIQFIKSAIVSIELGGILRFILWQEGIPYRVVSPSVVKKFVTGTGAAKKELMMMEVFKRWAYSSSVNDEADAFALAQLGLAAHQCAVNCTKPMLAVAQEWWAGSESNSAQPKKKPLRNSK
jgi:Holliday junction resolvasome RuvABC endonuclease subunit